MSVGSGWQRGWAATNSGARSTVQLREQWRLLRWALLAGPEVARVGGGTGNGDQDGIGQDIWGRGKDGTLGVMTHDRARTLCEDRGQDQGM